MPGVDAAWLRMDDPANLMMVTGLFFFARPVPPRGIRDLVAARLLRYRRFGERAVPGRLGGARWERVEAVDLDRHVLGERLPEPGDKAALERRVSELMSEPLDPLHPLWQFHVVQNCVGGTAVVVRIHHCVADGIALMQVALSLTESGDGQGALVPHAAPALGGPLRRIGIGLLCVGTLLRMTLRPADPRTPQTGPPGIAKGVAWTPAIPFEDVRAVKDALDATVNDVLLTAVAGALRRHLVERGVRPAALDLRAAVPVNLRPERHMDKLGNCFGLIFVALPVGIADPLERLRVLKARLDALKRSTEPLTSLAVLRVMGHLPRVVQGLLVRLFGSKITAVMTNVPGPRTHLTMAGERVDGILFWVPQSGRAGLGVSLFSYAGTVRVGVAADRGLVPDPGGLVRAFEAELDALRAAAGVPSRES